MLFACSSDEVIRIGTPHNSEGTTWVKFSNEITDSEVIHKVRTIVENSQGIDKPILIEVKADVFFQLNNPSKGISEIDRYIWFQEDGSAILYNEAVGYSTLTKEQTLELKSILGL